MKIFKKICTAVLAAVATVTIVGCGGDEAEGSGSNYNNENVPLIFSSAEVDKVFNPFFSTNGADSNIVAMTQISMLGTTKDGSVAYGEDEAVVVLDYSSETTGVGDNRKTTYKFVLKNNVKYSNGTPLTMKDVLFNMYVYLDPVYTGSNTMYSTDIVGLSEYRTQQATEAEQENFNTRFQQDARQRITDLILACNDILRANPALGTYANFEAFRTALQNASQDVSYGDNRQYFVSDFDDTYELFEKELQQDYSNSLNQYEDIVFKDKNDVEHTGLFSTDVEVFLNTEGYISWDREKGELTSSLVNDVTELKSWTREQAISTVLQDYMPGKIGEVLSYWATADEMFTNITNEFKEAYFNNNERPYKSIQGIRFANMNESAVVNGKTYAAPKYNTDGSVQEGSNEVLEIQINGVDPKAIWNFAFAVAPMYYYSDTAHIEAFNYVDSFGVEYASQSFMSDVVNDSAKVGVPVGAGAYQASNRNYETTNITGGTFCDSNTIYFVRNEYYLMGVPAIKKIAYQVVPSNQMLNVLYNGAADFVQPNAKPENVSEISKDPSYSQITQNTLGYGYIGINASFVPSLYVRQAIMHSIDTSLTVSYYGTTAKPIYRSMSLESWAYPTGATSYYPYIGDAIPSDLSVVNPNYKNYVESINKTSGQKLTPDEQEDFIIYLVETLAGYRKDSSGVYRHPTNNDTLKYVFTIAGSTDDHPAFTALYRASESLNQLGFSTEARTSANALSDLSNGRLAVWAAAWSSTIDPDMYQVYHKESSASSTKNWGYNTIYSNPNLYSQEIAIIDDLSELIEDGRSTEERITRTRIYAEALDKVMELAIELPTYQRVDLYAYANSKVDSSSLTDSSAFVAPTERIWEVRLNEIQ